jgi:hypothetical protein
MLRWIALTSILVTGACSGDQSSALATCEEALQACEPSGSIEAATGVTLTSYEHEVLQTLLESVKAGVRPYTETSLGICPLHSVPAKKRECEVEAILSPGELSPGKYILYSEWFVPDVGERGTFKLSAEIECVTTHIVKDGSEQTSTRTYKKDAEPVYAGPDRGWRFSPLYTITSPNPNGRMECTYVITSPHGDGDKRYEGSWSVPAAPKE